MRRALTAFAAALALAGCASTSNYYRDGSADYYYERDYAPVSYGYFGFGYGYGYGYGAYDPFWAPHGFYGGWSPWGYGAYYTGWNYSPWYDVWWGGNFYDWSRWQREQDARARVARVRGEGAAIAAMPRDRGEGGRAETAALAAPGRLAAPIDANGRRLRGPDSWAGADESRQLRTDGVDPYYGVPRVRRGEGMPARDGGWRMGNERPQRGMPVQERGIPDRDNRPIHTGPAFREPAVGAPAPRRDLGAPVRESAPGGAAAPRREFAPAPIRSFDSAPAPSFDRAPTFSPRSVPSSAPSRDGGSRTERR